MGSDDAKKVLRTKVATRVWVFLAVFAAGWICGFATKGWFV